MGARPLNRVIQTRLQDPLAEDIIAGKIQPGDLVYVSASGDEIVIGTEDIPEEPTTIKAQDEGEEKEWML